MARRSKSPAPPARNGRADTANGSASTEQASANTSSGKGFLARAFVPNAAHVPPDYWHKRRFDHAIGCADAARNALTAQAQLVAIGVGRSGASPLAAIVVAEVNDFAARCIGLWLSSRLGSARFAARARLVVALDYVVAPLLGVFSVLLLAFPGYLRSLTLASAVLTACKPVSPRFCGDNTVVDCERRCIALRNIALRSCGVGPHSCAVLLSAALRCDAPGHRNCATVPAHAAMYAHMQASGLATHRAEVNRTNGNQNRVLALLRMGIRWAVLTWAGPYN